jgi:hypothetical protein
VKAVNLLVGKYKALLMAVDLQAMLGFGISTDSFRADHPKGHNAMGGVDSKTFPFHGATKTKHGVTILMDHRKKALGITWCHLREKSGHLFASRKTT